MELKYNPFILRIISIFKEDSKSDEVDLEQFIILMSVFLIQTDLEKKKRLLFRIFDKDNRNILPITDLKGVISEQLFLRSHYMDDQKKTVFSDRELRNVMDEIFEKYDKDANR